MSNVQEKRYVTFEWPLINWTYFYQCSLLGHQHFDLGQNSCDPKTFPQQMALSWLVEALP